MTTLSDAQDALQIAHGRSDTDSLSVYTQGLNAAILACALLYEPPELRTSGSLTATSSQNYVSISTLTRPLRIEHIWNSTGSQRLWPLSLNELNILYLPTSGNVLYYALYGNVLHYRPQPSSNETLTVYFLQYPSRLQNAADVLPMAMYEDFIYAFASSFIWASFEEGESATIWSNIATQLNLPLSLMTSVRKAMRGEVPIDDDVQRTLQQGTLTS